MEKQPPNPTDLARAVRESFPGAVEVFTRGRCYSFYLILRSVFPQARPWCNHDHVITEIDGRFYDVTGEVSKEGFCRLDKEPHILKGYHRRHLNSF